MFGGVAVLETTKTYDSAELRYLRMLSRQYPTVQAASTEIVNLQAIMNLPKGTEHFLSDVHGEYEAFLHILNSCSGVVREKLDDLFATTVSHTELDQLATLIWNGSSRKSPIWTSGIASRFIV